MKRFAMFIAVLLFSGMVAAAQEVVKKGDPIGNSQKVTVADTLKDPKSYENKTITVEGVGERVCTNMGCWVEIADKKGGPTLFVKIKQDKFSLPLEVIGMKVRAEGTLEVKTITKDQADHYESEGRKLKRNADGTAYEVRLNTTAVELEKTKA